jgi:putative ABC transport system ATP-binding protein
MSEPTANELIGRSGSGNSGRLGEPLLVLRGIERTFHLGETRVHALRGVDLDVRVGEFVAIWGPSGSGKSTLLNTIGLVDRPGTGTMRLEGRDVLALDDNSLSDYRNQAIGFVFQSFNLIPVLTAVENVMMPLQISGVKNSEARRRALERLGDMGLRDLADFNTERLSGGQRQRVAIARALVGSPRLIIADEPTANLDTVTSTEIIDLMQQINQQTGVTFIFSTHDPRLLARVPRHLAMQDGRVQESRYGDTSSTRSIRPSRITSGLPAATSPATSAAVVSPFSRSPLGSPASVFSPATRKPCT